MTALLAPTDYEIIEAENGEQALAAIAKQRPDLSPDGCIIAVTSYTLDGEDKIARAAGCDDYVPKPFSPRELLAKIRQHLPLDRQLFAAVHMSAIGTKRTCQSHSAMSAFGGKADIDWTRSGVRP